MTSTIDTTVPGTDSPLTSAPIRNNFVAAANDIDGIQSTLSTYGNMATQSQGNVTITGGSIAGTALNAGSVPSTALAPIANNTVFGNVSGISASPIPLTQTQLTALINTFAGGFSGAVPASGGGTTNFLRADGTFAVPPGSSSGTVTTTGSPSSGNLTRFSSATSITNDDLSGDVTTSGSLVTTVAKIAGVSVGTPTGSGNVVFSNSPQLTTPALGTPSSVVLTNASGTAASLTAGAVTTINGHISAGTNISITGSGTIASPYDISSSGGGGGGTPGGTNGQIQYNNSSAFGGDTATTDGSGNWSATSLILSGLTVSELAATDGSKKIQSLSTSTYPSLTEISYVKGVTSAIQTQLNAKGSGTVTSVGLSSTNSTLVIGSTPVTTSGTITADINLSNANTWSGVQTFGNNISLGGAGLNVTSLATNNLLQYNGTNWVNVTPASIGAGVSSITGTSNQVIASASTGAVTLSLPQSIATTSTPQFAQIGIGAAASGSVPLYIKGTDSNSVPFFEMTDGTNSLAYYIGTAPNVQFGTPQNIPFIIFTNNTTAINILGSGLTAIGNFTPSYQLDVKSSATIVARFQNGTDQGIYLNSYASQSGFFSEASGLNGMLASNSSSNAALYAGGNPIITASAKGISIGTLTAATAQIDINSALTASAWGTSGIQTRFRGNTYTDSSSSGAVSGVTAINAIAQATIAASSAATYASAATLYIAGAPVAGTNATITSPYSLYVAAGNAYLPGTANTIGTVTSGTWNGSLITGTYGGTGVNNGSSTITIGGNVTFSGAYTFTGTLTANTSVTFPTSGTLAILGANTFTGLQTLSPASGIAAYVTAGAIEEAVYSNGSSGTSLALNLDNGNYQSVTITGAVTITMTTPAHPGRFQLTVTQNGTGYTYSFSGVKWAGGTQPTWSTAANAIDVISFAYDGTHFYGMGGVGFA